MPTKENRPGPKAEGGILTTLLDGNCNSTPTHRQRREHLDRVPRFDPLAAARRRRDAALRLPPIGGGVHDPDHPGRQRPWCRGART